VLDAERGREGLRQGKGKEECPGGGCGFSQFSNRDTLIPE